MKLSLTKRCRHNAKDYTDEIEAQLEQAALHPSNVGIGECGLDYHYNNSPSLIQQSVFARQIRLAVRLGKPLTVHTREADDDCWRILCEELPVEWKVHVHCFTDSPSFAAKLLDRFPNLMIGVTGVATFSSNENTRTVVKEMVKRSPNAPLRIVLETGAGIQPPLDLADSVADPFAPDRRLALHDAVDAADLGSRLEERAEAAVLQFGHDPLDGGVRRSGGSAAGGGGRGERGGGC